MTSGSSMLRSTQTHLRAMRYSLTGRRVRKNLFFLHIPKCGGTSLNKAMSNAFGSRLLRHGKCHTLHAVASRKAAEAQSMDVHRYRESLLLYAMAQDRANLIAGHYRFSEVAYQTFGDDWAFVTMLRDPVARWFSLYFYVRYSGIDHYRTDLSLEQFLASERGVEAGSDYVKLLTDTSQPEPCSSDAAIQQAIHNLEKFAVVGLLEKLGRFEQDFEKQFGAPLRVPRLNRSPATTVERFDEARAEIRQRVEEICKPNLQVFWSVERRLARDA